MEVENQTYNRVVRGGRLRDPEISEKYPGRKKVNVGILKKYWRGKGVDVKSIKEETLQSKISKREAALKKAEEEAARAEVLLTEPTGQLEASEGSHTSQITQREIRDSVDITTAAKGFDLDLAFGPYHMDFTKNGRNLLLGGKKGHLASFDWITKNLDFEINVMESIHDVHYLHSPNMLAVAQKNYVYIYDNQGIEIHCLKNLYRPLCLEFLPYHFLLCASNEDGYLHWLDVSLGQEVIKTNTHRGRLSSMCQNPYNAVLCCGHPKGTVTMWTPNDSKPVAVVLCHDKPMQTIDIDPTGRYLATAAVDHTMKIWDVRDLGKCLSSYKLGYGIEHLSFSQKGLLAASMKNVVEVYSDVALGTCKKAYMRYKAKSVVSDIQFCPFEDILGTSTSSGYSSLIIPGSGEPNFDALEANPYISKAGQKEAEIKSLLSKLPSELITLDPNTIAQVDTPTLEEKLEAKKQLLYIPVPQIDVEPRYRMKGKSGSAYKFKRKMKIHDAVKRKYYKDAHEKQKEAGLDGHFKEDKKKEWKGQVLERFDPAWKLKSRPALTGPSNERFNSNPWMKSDKYPRRMSKQNPGGRGRGRDGFRGRSRDGGGGEGEERDGFRGRSRGRGEGRGRGGLKGRGGSRNDQ